MPVLSVIDENCLSERRRLVGDRLPISKISTTVERKQEINMATNGENNMELLPSSSSTDSFYHTGRKKSMKARTNKKSGAKNSNLDNSIADPKACLSLSSATTTAEIRDMDSNGPRPPGRTNNQKKRYGGKKKKKAGIRQKAADNRLYYAPYFEEPGYAAANATSNMTRFRMTTSSDAFCTFPQDTSYRSCYSPQETTFYYSTNYYSPPQCYYDTYPADSGAPYMSTTPSYYHHDGTTFFYQNHESHIAGAINPVNNTSSTGDLPVFVNNALSVEYQVKAPTHLENGYVPYPPALVEDYSNYDNTFNCAEGTGLEETSPNKTLYHSMTNTSEYPDGYYCHYYCPNSYSNTCPQVHWPIANNDGVAFHSYPNEPAFPFDPNHSTAGNGQLQEQGQELPCLPPLMNRVHSKIPPPTNSCNSIIGKTEASASNDNDSLLISSQLLAAFHISPKTTDMPIPLKNASVAHISNFGVFENAKYHYVLDDLNSMSYSKDTDGSDCIANKQQMNYLLLALETKCSVEVIQALLNDVSDMQQPFNNNIQATYENKPSFLDFVIERLVGAMRNRLQQLDPYHVRPDSALLLKELSEDMECQRLWSILKLFVKKAAAENGLIMAIIAVKLTEDDSILLLQLYVSVYPQLVREKSGALLPIHQAILSGKSWSFLEIILSEYPECLLEKSQQDLYPCLLAATCSESSLDIVFQLLLANASWLAL